MFKSMRKHYNEFTTRDLRKHSEFDSQVLYNKRSTKIAD